MSISYPPFLTDKRHDLLNKNLMFIKREVKFYLLTQRIINDLGLDEIEANIASP